MAVVDIETDGLRGDVTKIHVLSYTLDGEDPTSLFDYDEMREFLQERKWIAGHDFIRYDKPVLEEILGIRIRATIYDTLPLSWYLNYDRPKHGLESFGEDFGVPKPKVTDWKNLTPEEYAHRCEEDVKINWLLFKDLTKRLKLLYKDRSEMDRFWKYLGFKMECASYQIGAGWRVDMPKVLKHIEELTKAKAEKVEELADVMPRVQIIKRKSPPKNPFKKDGTPSAHGQAWFELLDEMGYDRTYDGEVEVVTGDKRANPGSSDQVKKWLYDLGWQPCTFDYKKNDDGTERRIPQVRDDGELSASVKLLIEDNPAVAVLDGLTVINHRLGIFQNFADPKYVTEYEDGWYLKAEVAGLTNTLRFKHANPLVNLPGVDKPWGAEIRGSLIAPEGHILCGADMVSLESTTKRHFMYPYDPEYVEAMSQPGFDEHLDLATFAGAVSSDDLAIYNENKKKDDLSDNLAGIVKHVAGVRKAYKVTNYSAIYGVGPPKLSRTLGLPVPQCAKLLEAYWQRNWSVKKVMEAQKVRKINGQMWLLNPVSGFYYSLRFEKDIFSTLNQGTGVYCFDSWMAQCWVKGLKAIGQFHDEGIWAIPEGSEDETKQKMEDAIHAVNEKLQLNVPLGVDAQFGKDYAEVH